MMALVFEDIALVNLSDSNTHSPPDITFSLSSYGTNVSGT